MYRTLKTLIHGASARSEAQMRDHYAIELIDQKIRDSEKLLTAAKGTLASLIQRQRAEAAALSGIRARVSDLETRAGQALAAGREDLALTGAEAIVELEAEATQRQDTHDRLEARVAQLRLALERGHRRLIALRQGAVSARAVRVEQGMQRRLGAGLGADAMTEAEDLIDHVLQQDDPFEQGQILRDIDDSLTRRDAAAQLEEAGFGPRTKPRAQDVLARLKANSADQ